MTTVVSTELQITVGVDTHADAHVAAALDQLGRLLETHSVPTTPTGYGALLAWARSLGELERFGIEGTGSYGAGLARWLHGQGVEVVEVERPVTFGIEWRSFFSARWRRLGAEWTRVRATSRRAAGAVSSL